MTGRRNGCILWGKRTRERSGNIDDLKRQALALQEELTALRRDFHMHPELGLEEYRTAQRIEEELDKLGIAHRRVACTGVWATIPGTGKGNGAVVLRADIGEVSMLLTGDATISEFVGISKHYEREIDVDIFKNVHHAGTLSDSQIMTISPKITIFSTSSYNLPSDRYLQLLRDAGCEQIYFTCERFHGEIKLTTDGKDIAVYPQYEDNHVQWEKEHFGR